MMTKIGSSPVNQLEWFTVSLRVNFFFSQQTPFKLLGSGVHIMAQQKGIWPGTMRVWVQSLALLNGLRIQCCCELWCRLQIWLSLASCRLAATALIRPLAWEPPYATGEALKRQKHTHAQSNLCRRENMGTKEKAWDQSWGSLVSVDVLPRRQEEWDTWSLPFREVTESLPPRVRSH